MAVMYLEHDDWSPRYQETFYTMKLEHFELCASDPNHKNAALSSSSFPPKQHLGSKTNFPAYYYKAEVFCGRHPPRTVFRRYSQFKWLYENLRKTLRQQNERSSSSSSSQYLPPIFPSGSGCLNCAVPQTENFAKRRMYDLREFLEEALTRKDVASHEAVARFLELDAFGRDID